MSPLSSEEALNNIFNLLTTMMNQFAEADKKRDEGKTEDNVSQLINGLIDNKDSKAAANAGLQLESLAKGIEQLSKLDTNAIKEAGVLIDLINDVINRFNVPSKLVDDLDNLVDSILYLGKIDGDLSKNLSEFITGTKSSFDQIVDLSNTFNSIDINSNLTDGLNGAVDAVIKLNSVDIDRLSKLLIGFNNLIESIDGFDNVNVKALSSATLKIYNVSLLLDKIDIQDSSILGINRFADAVKNVKAIDVDSLLILAEHLNKISSSLNSFTVDRKSGANIDNFISSIERLNNIKNIDISGIKDFSDNFAQQLNILNSALKGLQDILIPKDPINNINAVLSTLIKFNEINLNNFDSLSEQIAEIMESINEIEITRDTVDSIDILCDALRRLTDINNMASGKTANISQLTDVMSKLNSLGDDSDNIEQVISSINKLGNIDTDVIDNFNDFLLSLKIDNIKEIRDSVNVMISTVKSLEILSKIDTKALNKTLKRLKPELADNLAEFLKRLTLSLKKFDAAEVQRIIKPVANLFNGLSAIISTNVFKLRVSLNPIRGYLLGRLIGLFIKQIINAVQGAKVPKNIEFLGKILEPLGKLADPKEKFSVWKIRKALSKRTAHAISNFFIEIVRELKKNETDLKVSLKNIDKFLELINKLTVIAPIQFKLATMMLSISSAKKFNAFIRELTKGDWDSKRIDSMSKFLTKLILTYTVALGSIVALVTFAPLTAVIAGFAILHYGLKGIKKMILELMDPKSGIKKKEAEGAADLLKSVSRLLIGVTITIGSIAIISSLFGMEHVILSLIITRYALTGITKIISQLAQKEISEGTKNAAKTFREINYLLLSITGAIVILTLLSKYTSPGDMLMSVATLSLAFGAITGIIVFLTHKIGDKDIDSALNAMQGISKMIVILSLSISLLAVVNKYTDSIWSAFGVITLTVAVMTSVVMILSHYIGEKDLKQAIKTIHALTLMIVGISASIALLALVFNKFDDKDVWQGLVMVTLVLGMMTGVVLLLSHKIKRKNLRQANETLIVLTGSLVIISLVTEFLLIPIGKHLGDALKGVAAVTIVLGSLVAMTKWISTFKQKKLRNSLEALIVLTACLTVVSIVVRTLLIPIGKKAGEAALGAVVTLGTVLALVGILAVLMLVKLKKLKQSIINLGIITAELLIISLIIKTLLIPIGQEAKAAALGAAVALGTVIALVGILAVLMTIKLKKLKQSIINLGVITAELLIIGLIIKTLLIPIGQEAGAAALGATVAVVTVVAMLGMVFLLSKIPNKAVYQSLITMAALTVILIAVSATIRFLLIPVGENAKEAAYGAAVALGVVMVMIGMSYLLSLIKREVLMKNLVTMAALTAMLVVVSLTAKYLLIPIGKEAKSALYGAGVSLMIVGAMLGIMWLLGKALAKQSKEFTMAMAKGALFLAAAAGILWLIGQAVPGFIEVSKMVGEDPKKIAIGGAIILGAIGIITAMMIAVGEFAKNPYVALGIAIGAVVLAAATGILWMIGKVMITFTDVIKAISQYSMDTLTQSLKGVGIIFAIMAESLVGVIGLSGLTVLAGATIVPLGLVVMGLFELLTYTADNILELNKRITALDIEKFNLLVYDKDNKNNPNTLVGAINNIMDGLTGLGVWRSVLSTIISVIIRPIIDTVSLFIDIILKVATAHYVVGYDDNGKPIYERIPEGSFGLAASQVSNGFAEFLTKINEGFRALDTDVKLFGAMYAKTLKPIVKLVGQFVDIVMKVATGTYITGFDENGKPQFQHLTAQEFGAAGTQVSVQFAIFLGALNDGFSKLTARAYAMMKLMKNVMGPVIKLVSQFVDVVLKVATGTYVMGYDDNGKPEYEHLTASDFSAAGIAVTTLFSYFLNSLNREFSKMSASTIIVMKMMKKAVGPIMEMLSKFVDAVLKVATGTYISGYDEEGHAEITHIENEDFIEAGVAVAATFGYFIDSLNESFSKLSPTTIDAIKSMDGSLKPIMESVSSFVDAIIKYASGLYIYAYDKDKDGNYTVPLFAKITDTMMSDAAESIANNFALFIDKLIDVFDSHGNFWGNKTEDALKAIGDSIGPVMDGLSTYVDAIMAVATGTYIDHMEKDKDGKLVPSYKHLLPSQFKDAAVTVANMFFTFVNTLIKKFSDDKFKEQAKNVQDIINDAIKPIMEAVKNFSDALKPFLDIKKTVTGKDGKKEEQFVCFQKGMIQQIASDIATGFVDFIKIVSEGLTNEQMKKYYKEVKKVSKSVSETLDNIKKAAANLGKTIKSLTDEKASVVEKGPEAARGFINVLNIFTDFYKNNEDFKNSVEAAKACSLFMKTMVDISKRYNDIINRVGHIDDKKTSQTAIVNMLNKNTLSMARNMLSIYETIENVNFSKIYELMAAYSQMSKKYIELSLLMTKNPELEDGFMKFISGIRKLTNAGLLRQISSTGLAITTYTSHLNKFTEQVHQTTTTVKVYVTAMESAKKVLAAFDELLVNKAKQREQALQNLADKINNIAAAIDNMRGAFEALDENAIIERFDGIKKLLEFAGIYDSEDKNKQTKTTQTNKQASTRPTPPRPTSNNTYNYGGGVRSGHVTFQFANTVLDGTFRMT